MKKVLLPTDFSENAYNAIRYAVQLLQETETQFYLLHAYIPPVYQTEYLLQGPAQFGLGDIIRDNAVRKSEAVKTRIEKEFNNPKHSFVTKVAFNNLVDEIVETQENEKADLVIMGTQGATGATEILFGTNTTQVIRNATCPVIAMPSGFEYKAPKSVLFPTDYEIDYEKEQLQQLSDIAKNHDSSIDVIHVSSGYELSEDQLRNKQKLHDILATSHPIFNDLPDQGVIEAINQFKSKKEIDLLVMIRNKHSFFERLFIEPVIKKIGFHIDIPFMVVPQVG